MKQKQVLTSLLFLLCFFTTYGQDTAGGGKRIISKLQSFLTEHSVEKAYLHFDKPYYAAGDTIYFKAYITQGEAHRLSVYSGVLHADLINERNKISNSVTMQVTDGVAWGDFALPLDLPKGNYRVRAYTQWMRNEGSDSFFDKTIPVGSALTADNVTPGAKPADAKPDIRFFPEGGSLVTGVRTKIAFKAVGPNGLGINVKGTVLDSDGKEVVIFTSAHLGMGSFYLRPLAGKTYAAKITYPDGIQATVELPKSSADAISFAFTDQNNSYDVSVSSGREWYRQNKGKSYTLIIFSGGRLINIAVKLDSLQTGFEVAKDHLHSGIATATLFSADGEPLCERLLFVRTNDLLNLNVKSDKDKYGTREKTTLTLNAMTGANAPAEGHFSVAVIDESKVPVDENSESTVINNLLLTSDLKGHVEQPNYYFTDINDKTNSNLDLVMLTHGYRKFEWKKILNDGNKPMAYAVEKGLSIGGQLKFGGKPLAGGAIKLFSKGKNGMILDTLANANGKFVFDNLSFYDSTKFVLQARTPKGQKDVEVKPDTTFSTPEIIAVNTPQPQVADVLSAYEQHAKKFLDEQDKEGINAHTHMLKEVTVKDKKIDPFVHSDNLNGKGNADQVITADWLEKSGYNNLYDALRAKATSIIFTPDHRLRSNRTSLSFVKAAVPDYMTLYVDGNPIFTDTTRMLYINHGPLDDIDASDVESVEIILGAHGAAIYGSQASGGAIIVTTKRGRKINNYYKESPGVITFKANGFYKAREFYAPKYEPSGGNRNKPDLRSTVYWNPEFTTGKDGNATITWHNADGTGNYRVVVEGIDAMGNLGRQVYRYKVE